jgi:release factor glutamine methyltransferase
MPTWRDLREGAQRALTDAGTPSPAVEARRMVEEASGRRGGELILADRDAAPVVAAVRVQQMVDRRIAGEPLQYALGSWGFLDLDVMVDGRVLIPRPETEVTARIAMEEAVHLGARPGRPNPFAPSGPTFVIADLGTGSGVLAITLARRLRDAEVWATDVSDDALAVARANLAGAGSAGARVRLAQGDWFDALPPDLRGHIDLVVANPPYVAEAEAAELPPEVADHEPRVALVCGPTGFEAIERIVSDTPAWLTPAGSLVCEISSRRSDLVVDLARDAGFVDVRVERDLAQRDRVLIARRA